MKYLLKNITLILLVTFNLLSFNLFAEVELPRGEYHTTVTDLSVKVMGGSVSVNRQWYQGKWTQSRLQSTLELEIDSTTNKVISITRNNQYYKVSSDGLHFVFDEKKSIDKIDTGYRWTDKTGSWIEYDNNGVVVKYSDRTLGKITFIYNTANQRVGVKDRFDVQRLWYEYNADGQIASARDAADVTAAREVKYNYTNGILTSVIDVHNNTWQYEYTVFIESSKTSIPISTTNPNPAGVGVDLQYAKAQLTKIIDPEGRPTNISYHPSGRTASVTKADGTGVFYKFDYDKTKKEYYVQQKYSGGRINEKWFDKEGETIRRDVNGTTTETITFNGRNRIHKNELGFETIKEYDEFKNLTKIIHSDKSFRSYTYDTQFSLVAEKINELGVKTKYDYDANGLLTQVTEALGLSEQRIMTYTYDGFGNQTEVKRLADSVTEETKTTYIYDISTTNVGNRLTKTVSVSATENHTTNYDSYNTQGNLLEWRDARGKIWKQTFNNKGQRTSITDPLNHATQFGYDASGKLTLTENALNNKHASIYDINGRLEKNIDPYTFEQRHIYNASGQLITTFDEENYKQEMAYDAMGRISSQTDGAGNSISLEYGVNKIRNVTQNQLAAKNHPTFREEYQYDKRARIEKTITKLTTNLEHITSKTYNAVGKIKTKTDAELKITKYDYDNLNRLVTITYPDLTKIKYDYDNRDNLLTITNEKQVVFRSYTYDRKNRLKIQVWPSGKFTQFFYDVNDNLIQVIDNKGQLTENRYDNANRLDLKKYFINTSATAPVKNVSFTYNNANTLTGYVDGISSAVYTIDDLQRKTDETVNFGSFSKTITTSYYKNRLKKTFAGADNITNTYSYDAGKRLSQISIPSEGSIIYNSYHWNSPEKITYPGGLTRTISYDPIMRIKHINNSDSASNSLMDYDYGYDKVGNIQTKITEHGNYVYDYDERYRLSSVDNPVVPNVSSLADEAYTYDDAGNRLTDLSTTGNWIYNTDNQLKSYSDITIDYDFNGNTVKKTKAGVVTTFDYNTENRLTTVKNNSGATIASYYYDPFGRRLYKEVAGIRTYFMYSEEGLIAELDSTGSTNQTYAYRPQSTYGTTPLYTKTALGYAYYQVDHLGAPQKLVSKTGEVVWSMKTQSFGETMIGINIFKNNIRFPGQYYDVETGLNYNFYRYYDSEVGRYITNDPIDIDGGLNTYLYALNNSIRFIDSYGLFDPTKSFDPTKPYGGVCKKKHEDCKEFAKRIFELCIAPFRGFAKTMKLWHCSVVQAGSRTLCEPGGAFPPSPCKDEDEDDDGGGNQASAPSKNCPV